MRKGAARLMAIDLTTVGVTRLLVVSYFIGIALGLIRGVDVAVLLLPVTGETIASLMSSILLLGLSTLILLDIYRRPAALVLALVVFWASYLTLVHQSGPEPVGAFWRDLALIGALLLTYGQSIAARGAEVPAPANAPAQPSQPQDIGDVFPDSPYAASRHEAPRRRTSTRKRVRTEVYRQDLEVIRST